MALDTSLIAAPVHTFYFSLRASMHQWYHDQCEAGLKGGVDYAQEAHDQLASHIQCHARIFAVEVGVELQKAGLGLPSTQEWAEIMKIIDPAPLSETIQYHFPWKSVASLSGVSAIACSFAPGLGTAIGGVLGASTGALIGLVDRGDALKRLEPQLANLIDVLLVTTQKQLTHLTDAIMLRAKHGCQ